MAVRDFGKGIVGGISERGIKAPTWLAKADNVYGRPYRGLRVRGGTRDLSSAVLSDEPHSLMGYYNSGGNKLFVGAGAKILLVGSSSYTLQSLPASHPANSDIYLHTNLDGVLVATQRGGALTPLMYDGAWKELKLPKPTDAIGFAADTSPTPPQVGVDTGSHYYRIRWRFEKGSSLVGPVSAVHTVSAGPKVVNINAGLTASVRSDYIGWTLERTKVNAPSSAGPWWFVKDGTGTSTTDDTPDASLGYMADEGIHTEPVHFDGITSWQGRLWGWVGSLLQCSQDSNGEDPEATGIANWDPDLTFPVAMDDGDTIQLVLPVPKGLLILKRRSVHLMSGVDPDSFVLEHIVYADPSRGSEAGCAGPRAGCVIRGVAYFWGESGGMFTYDGGKVRPVAWVEVGHYLDDVNTAALDKLLLVNHQGNFMLAWYPPGSATTAKEQVVFDARQPQWFHWKDWVARDAIEMKSSILGAASMAFCDPTNRATFGVIANGASVTGSGISGGTTVVGAVASGDTSLVLSAPAFTDLQNVTLSFDGVPVAHCNISSGSTTVTISAYHCWSAFEGFTDRKAVAGTGGIAQDVMFETPWLDNGMPDDWKSLERIAVSCSTDQPVDMIVNIATDPPGGSAAVALKTKGAGSRMGSFIMGTDQLSTGFSPTTASAGVPMGTIGRRFKVKVTARPGGDFRPSGIEMVAVLLPDKEYNQ